MTTKKQTIFSYRLHLLIAINGLILDFELMVANCNDLEAGFELLNEETVRNSGRKTAFNCARSFGQARSSRSRNAINICILPSDS
jgi:hypothetical protein